MRRTHTNDHAPDGVRSEMVADQLGHNVDGILKRARSVNVYAQSSVASRLPIVNQLEKRLAVQ
jgi:hypothetical protein